MAITPFTTPVKQSQFIPGQRRLPINAIAQATNQYTARHVRNRDAIDQLQNRVQQTIGEREELGPVMDRYRQRIQEIGEDDLYADDTRAIRTDEQTAFRNAPTDLLKLLRAFQKLDDLLQIVLGLVDTSDITEGDATRFLRQKLGLGFAETHSLTATTLHLTHEKDPHADEEQHREPRNQHAEKGRHAVVGRFRADPHV